MDGLWLAGLAIAAFVGAAATVVRLPGTWLLVIAACVHSWHYGWQRPHWQVLIVLVVLSGIAEIVELFLSLAAARHAGASRRGTWCALIGGIVGMFVFTIPLFIVGTVLGGALGCFLGALIGELTVKNDLAHGTKVGIFAAIGVVMGTVAKTMIALLMGAVVILKTL